MDKLSPEEIEVLAAKSKVIGVAVAFPTFALIAIVLRFFTRVRFTRGLGYEDYLIAVSMCFSIVMGACQIASTKWGTGRPAMFVHLNTVIWNLKYLYVSILAYCTSLTLTKMSILLQYRRIFSTKEARIPIYLVMALCVGCGLVSLFTCIFTCVPVDAFWDVLKRPSAKCVHEHSFYLANAAMSIATDVLVVLLPIKGIWSLQIAKRQKIALILILTVGWVVCIVSILRLHSIVQATGHPDKAWYSAAPAYWSSIEVNLAIVCASTPALKPLVVKIIPRFSSTRSSSGNSSRFLSDLKRSLRGRSSFIPINVKNNHSNTESGNTDVENCHYPLAELQRVQYPNRQQLGRAIRVTRDIEQHYDCADVRTSEDDQRSHSSSANVFEATSTSDVLLNSEAAYGQGRKASFSGRK
ncbi:hypothetical protein CC80DRAFT_464073 [Byssothecium circinans]|uniref:Rhodopsin domain-containing protein n=1 Tax=Byssothecium circinans TaxID=147558 RepID=A0A6A5UEH0_9PLEO|nr:hypothetical protein CC80DRAFT_464073 [Byssothecium circinans]